MALRLALGAVGYPLDPHGAIDALVLQELDRALELGDTVRPVLEGVVRAQLALTILPRQMMSDDPAERSAAWRRAAAFSTCPAREKGLDPNAAQR